MKTDVTKEGWKQAYKIKTNVGDKMIDSWKLLKNTQIKIWNKLQVST